MGTNESSFVLDVLAYIFHRILAFYLVYGNVSPARVSAFVKIVE